MNDYFECPVKRDRIKPDVCAGRISGDFKCSGDCPHGDNTVKALVPANGNDGKIKYDNLRLTLEGKFTENLARKTCDALLGMTQSTPFWWGDYLLFCEAYLSDKASQFFPEHINKKTLQNAMWVCRAIPPDRRRTELEFTHHSEVAALEPNEQKRYLSLAVDEGMSCKELRQAIKGPKEEKPEKEFRCPRCGHAGPKGEFE